MFHDSAITVLCRNQKNNTPPSDVIIVVIVADVLIFIVVVVVIVIVVMKIVSIVVVIASRRFLTLSLPSFAFAARAAMASAARGASQPAAEDRGASAMAVRDAADDPRAGAPSHDESSSFVPVGDQQSIPYDRSSVDQRWPRIWLADAVVDIARLVADRPMHSYAHQWVRQVLTASHMREHPLTVACTARGHNALKLAQQHRDAAMRVTISRMALPPAGGPHAIRKHYRQAGMIAQVNAIVAEICLAGAGEPCDFNRSLAVAAVTRCLDPDVTPASSPCAAGIRWNVTAARAMEMLTCMQALSLLVLGVADLPESWRQGRLLLDPARAREVDFAALRRACNRHARIAEQALDAICPGQLRACAQDTHAGLLEIAASLGRSHVAQLPSHCFVAPSDELGDDDE